MKAGLVVDLTRCIRRRFRGSKCSYCADSCPVDAIELSDKGPQINPYACILCLNCVGACPLEAIQYSGIDSSWWRRGSGDELTISCMVGDVIVCVNAIKIEHLIALLGRYEKIRLRIACRSCSLRGRGVDVIEEARKLLGDRVEVAEEAKAPVARRRALAVAASLTRGEPAVRVEYVDERSVKSSEPLLYREAARVADRLGIAYTRKAPHLVDPMKCDMCGFCSAICPTGAIEVLEDGIMVVDADSCSSCNACVEACPKNVLSMSPAKGVKRYYRPMRVCPVCGYAYPAELGECPKCSQLRSLVLEFYGVRKG
jgi:Fe-S-cluster-containing hydrogenase component 2